MPRSKLVFLFLSQLLLFSSSRARRQQFFFLHSNNIFTFVHFTRVFRVFVLRVRACSCEMVVMLLSFPPRRLLLLLHQNLLLLLFVFCCFCLLVCHLIGTTSLELLSRQRCGKHILDPFLISRRVATTTVNARYASFCRVFLKIKISGKKEAKN